MPARMVQQLQLDAILNKALTFITGHQARLSLLTSLGLIAASGWLTGQLVWSSLDESQAPSRWSPPSVRQQASVSQAPSLSPLLNAHLFGRYSDKPVAKPVTPQVVDAPKTRLNLTLVGAVASSDPSRSLAIIANRGKQDTYGVGEVIDGTQAKLKAVLADRAIIENQGQDETLMLQGIEYSKLSQQSQRVSPPVTESTSRVDRSRLEQIRSEISANPQSVLKYIRLSQVRRDGKLMGYRVAPGSQRELFDSVGLKDGDIATQLNGDDLTDPATMGKLMQLMNELTELNLTVERDGQLHDIFIEF